MHSYLNSPRKMSFHFNLYMHVYTCIQNLVYKKEVTPKIWFELLISCFLDMWYFNDRRLITFANSLELDQDRQNGIIRQGKNWERGLFLNDWYVLDATRLICDA